MSTTIISIILFSCTIICLIAGKIFYNSKLKQSGFLLINPHRKSLNYILKEEIPNITPVVKAFINKQNNVYSNTDRILLSHRSNGILIEDKNYKNSILVNRRRSRRYFLHNGDIIDIGNLTIMYYNTIHIDNKNSENINRYNHRLPNERKFLLNTPTLVPDDARKKTIYLNKNITTIGRSETNDIITKFNGISYRHAKIKRISGKYKIIDLNSENGTFVNGRRIKERYLKNGDEILFDSIKYNFSTKNNNNET